MAYAAGETVGADGSTVSVDLGSASVTPASTQSVTVTVVGPDSTSPVPKEMVEVAVDGASPTSAALSGGVAHLTLPAGEGGIHQVRAQYDGVELLLSATRPPTKRQGSGGARGL